MHFINRRIKVFTGVLKAQRRQEERENPKEVEGVQALFVVNLEPREMMGELSDGMLFDIGYADKLNPVLAIPEKPVPSGTRVG